nr:retrovirus-related Pol polyprotein from transposon TNT 1-94 [Tanacetum cinerariifolium]
MGKSKKKPHKPKSEDTNQEKLYLLHMDLCGPMCVASINRKKYILVIVDDYSQFIWVKCLRSKDEAPDFIIKFLKMIQLRLKAPVRRIRTDNGTEFVNLTLCEYYEKVCIFYETSVARLPHQNGVVKRRNRTLIEAARTIENLEKLQSKADIGIFIRYASTKKAFRIYNRRTRRIIKTIHVDFDELTIMASEHSSLEPALYEMTPATISSGLVPSPLPSTLIDLPTPEVISLITEVVALEPAVSTGSPSSTTIDQDAPSPSNSQTSSETQSLVIFNDVKEENHDLDVAHRNNDLFFGISIPKNVSEASSSSDVIPTVVHTIAPNSKHTKYALESLKKYGMESSDPVDTLIVEKFKLDKDPQGKAVDPTHYHGMVGTLIYLTTSRPDLTFVVCMCARYQEKPTKKHLHAVKRIFKYLRGIVNRGLWYLKDYSIALTAYADANHAGCQDTR